MNKFYITHGNTREYYAYRKYKDKIVYQNISEREIALLLSKMIDNEILKITEKNENTIEITYKNGIILVLDDKRVFRKKGDNMDVYMERLLRKIYQFIKNANIKIEKETLNKNINRSNNKKVNRNRKNNKGKKEVIGGLAIILSIYSAIGAAHVNNKESNDTYDFEENIPKISSNVKKSDNVSIENLGVYEEQNVNQVSLDFDDLTENGKLEKTIENCAPYLEKYIERYGLPNNLTYALTCQEYGELDCTVNKGGACGPMQIQVNAQHGEYYKVPIYENGVFTGEYDEFYAVDKERADEFAGKNVKIIQNLEDNFQIGCAYFRRCIDKYKNIFIAMDAYNKGLYAFIKSASEEELEYYMNNYEDFGWTKLIPKKYGDNYGDKNYLWNVLRYMETDTRGASTIIYYYQGEPITIELVNENVNSKGFLL